MPSAPLNKFRNRLQSIDLTRSKMDNLFKKRSIANRDIDAVYEALFLRAVTSFEVYLEDLFMLIMKNKTQYDKKRKVATRMNATSDDALMDILLQSKEYMGWLPFQHTVGRANIYLKEGRPFSELDDRNKNAIRSITVIRNAIAHKSTHATDQFKKHVIGTRSLLTKEKTPAGFLRSNASAAPPRNQFQNFVGQMATIAVFLSD
jgi:hypothetical protein